LFDRWVKDNKIARSKITPLYKLMFIGKRGMGALEFEPATTDFDKIRDINLSDLYNLSLKVLEDRRAISIGNEELNMQSLLAVGTSAGGRQMKAIIAIDPLSGAIRSGQNDALEGYEYCILKFGNAQMPTTEIEMAYYNMATAAGITMEHCRIMETDCIKHFITRRFDRKDGRKLHVQTLAAINTEATSYEDLIATCRLLRLQESELSEIFRRLVFNVLGNNTDDHNKNFSFVMCESGEWHLSPAYDVTFIFNTVGNGAMDRRCLSLTGKFSDITLSDIIEFAKENDISNAQSIIEEVACALKLFPLQAAKYSIPYRWSCIVWNRIKENLASFGFIANDESNNFTDAKGRQIKDAVIRINAKGHFEITAEIDGQKMHKFIRPNMQVYAQINSTKVGDEAMRRIIGLVGD
jgi:serine/threonine-protein kinase HipA